MCKMLAACSEEPLSPLPQLQSSALCVGGMDALSNGTLDDENLGKWKCTEEICGRAEALGALLCQSAD